VFVHHRITGSLAVLAVTLVVATGTTTACSNQSATGNAAGATVSSGAHLDPAAFSTAMTQPNTVIVDVRTPAEYGAGHIAGAINIDVESADFNSQIANLDSTKTYALYCHSGRRSGIAITSMQQAGFKSVYDLNGGIQNWQSSGGTLVTS
jgi:rhodanese-related sulfurtransferase